MRTTLIFLIVFLHLQLLVQGGEEPCAIEGQVYTECGSACPPTCADPGPRICTRQCVRGCQCPPRTVLDEDANKCVHPKDCSTETRCPIEGQVYMECGSACPPTCTDPNPTCIAVCVEGCQCPPGIVLDEDANKCVNPEDCPTENQCPIEGQVYMECGSACPPTCTDPNPTCIAMCVEGCQCPPGTVLDEDANKCVNPEDCPTETRCPIKGQVYMECGSACPPTCTDPNPTCIAMCVESCQCPPSTVLDEDANKCVNPEDCANVCHVDPDSGDVYCTEGGTTTFKKIL